MIPKAFSEYFSTCDQLHQQVIIGELLQLTMENERLTEISPTGIIMCPHCNSKAIRGNGKLKGMQRYICKGCNKNFSQSTGKFWFALKKRDHLIKYLHCLISGYSIRKSAGLTGISIQTSFDWRHKLLTSFKTVIPDGFRGIVEINDLSFEYSEKGKRRTEDQENNNRSNPNKSDKEAEKIIVIATCDRSGSEDIRVVSQGSINKEDIVNALKGRIHNAEVLISNGEKSHYGVSDKLQLELKITSTNKRQRKSEEAYHMQNINNMYTRLISFMIPFHGVATKYLQNYMNWFLVLERIQNTIRKISAVGHIAISSGRAWYDFKASNINIYFRT